VEIFGKEKSDYDSKNEEDSDEKTYRIVIKWYASVEQHQTCKAVLGEYAKKDFSGGDLLPNLNPYLSPSKITSSDLAFHKQEPSSKDYVD
jgi:hypothetical protein